MVSRVMLPHISQQYTMSLLVKCTSRHSQPNSTTFPDLPAIITWIRFLLGGLYGLSLGLRAETRGMVGALFGLNVIAFLPMFWFNSYLGADVDSYKSLNFVGVLNGFAFMILVWVVLFTWEHGEEEVSLGKVIGEVVKRSAVSDSNEGHIGMEEEF